MVIEAQATPATQAILEETEQPSCKHHWVIEPANGRISMGECQVCHKVKEFHNSISEYDRE